MSTLIIKNLYAEVDGKEILKGVDLEIKGGKLTQLWDQMVQGRAR